jgi:hypothetical protein
MARNKPEVAPETPVVEAQGTGATSFAVETLGFQIEDNTNADPEPDTAPVTRTEFQLQGFTIESFA